MTARTARTIYHGFAKARPALPPKTNDAKRAAWLYALILALLVVAQLIDFNGFLSLIDSMHVSDGTGWPATLAGLVVFSELFAIPFLLRLRLSVAFRAFSMLLGWLVPALWLYIALWDVLTVNAIQSIGLLGTVVPLMPGWWAVFIMVALAILSGWASWGLWPFPQVVTVKPTQHKVQRKAPRLPKRP